MKIHPTLLDVWVILAGVETQATSLWNLTF